MNETRELAKRKESIPGSATRKIPVAVPLVDIYESDAEILLRADIPGVEKKDVTVKIDNGKLSLSGIRKIAAKGSAQWEDFGTVEYHRTFSVPQTIDPDKIIAELKNGVLNLRLPKSETAKPRQIEVSAA